MSSSDLSVDEEMISRELKKILAQDMPTATPEEKRLFADLESRIASANSKMLGDGKGNTKKKSLKAKILAASSLARTREQALRKAQADPLASEQANIPTDVTDLAQAVKDKIKSSYKVTAPGDIRKQLEEDGDLWKHGGMDSDSEEEEEGTKHLEAVTGHSPLERLQRSVRKAQLLARATGAGDADSDEEVRSLTQESEAWLKRQKDLERQLLATSGKSALRNKYMNKEVEGGGGVGPTDKEIEELFERVVTAPERGRMAGANAASALTPGGKPRQDMADVVRRAMALRAEANKSKGRTPTTRRSARRAFPVQLDEDEEGEGEGSSDEDDDDDDEDDDVAKCLGMPNLATPSDSSDDEDVPRKLSARTKPRFNLRQQSSFDLSAMDDLLAMEQAKRQLGSVKPPKLAKGDPLSRSFDAPGKGRPSKEKTTIPLQPMSARPELGRPIVKPAMIKTSIVPAKVPSTLAKAPASKGPAAKGPAAKSGTTTTAKGPTGRPLSSAKSKETIPLVVNGKRTVTAGLAKPISRSVK